MSQHEKDSNEVDQSERHDQGQHVERGKDKPDKRVTEFLALFQDFRARRRLSGQLMALRDGDWEALRQIAEAEGFSVTIDDLKSSMPDTFFKGQGKNPDIFWSR